MYSYARSIPHCKQVILHSAIRNAKSCVKTARASLSAFNLQEFICRNLRPRAISRTIFPHFNFINHCSIVRSLGIVSPKLFVYRAACVTECPNLNSEDHAILCDYPKN